MPVTYAGIDLTPPAFAPAEVERWWHAHRVTEFEHPAYLTAGIDHLPLPAPPSRHPPRVGVLHWPNGASRWATCHLLATGGQLARLPTSSAAAGLVISDGTRSVTAPMYRLAARPVSQRGDGAELYLVTLVDERYYWWQSGDGLAPASPASWSALLTSLFTAVGVVASVGSINSNYGTPDATRWGVGYAAIPLLIDAAARTVGMRVVRSLAGAVSVVNYATAAASDSSQWATHKNEVMAGGRELVSEIGRQVPASVGVVFPGDSPNVTTKTLSGLALTEYGAATGVSGRVGRVGADLAATAGSTPRDNYATQAATDYYLWQLSLTDATLRSVRAWTPTGLESCVEWSAGRDELLTRVLRTPLNQGEQWGQKVPSGSLTAINSPTNVTVKSGVTTIYASIPTGLQWNGSGTGAGAVRLETIAASTTQQGTVTTADQSFRGVKTFDGAPLAPSGVYAAGNSFIGCGDAFYSLATPQTMAWPTRLELVGPYGGNASDVTLPTTADVTVIGGRVATGLGGAVTTLFNLPRETLGGITPVWADPDYPGGSPDSSHDTSDLWVVPGSRPGRDPTVNPETFPRASPQYPGRLMLVGKYGTVETLPDNLGGNATFNTYTGISQSFARQTFVNGILVDNQNWPNNNGAQEVAGLHFYDGVFSYQLGPAILTEPGDGIAGGTY
ncbi:hypothetical protein GobsT_31290 [Gemmata obscuriglobus]|uniref:Uncharacterized protein n=2 Tax=Gemmata obscuriglobus TaxID=114 RepID=A0A2Z3H2Z0_9BACT|nr:hypothetical protein [Gemmata obscuriglobus]AWM38682.1 hypothetical protein C1280_17945 [Gemmata obscuriglobus]QEG28352.1 hypothetical protein GobsT_31290 [Gemmata obscuriglobus]VTS06241.1 unnamed protein product [Gemmata obscuriglobus UQM 2246]